MKHMLCALLLLSDSFLLSLGRVSDRGGADY